MKLTFLMSHRRKYSVRDKVIGKEWIYLQRYALQYRLWATYQGEVKWSEGHSVVSYSFRPRGLYSPWNSPSQKTRVGSLSLLQGIFPSQGSNPGFPHCRWILYQLSHKGSPLKGWEAPKQNGNSFLFIFKMNHLFTEPGADQIHIQFYIYIF